MGSTTRLVDLADAWDLDQTERVKDLRDRVRTAMERPPEPWHCPERIDACHASESLAVRKARAVALKLSQMPVDLWSGQLIAGSMTLEEPRLHAEWGFPDYATDEEKAEAADRGLRPESVFGHIVPHYPKLLTAGLEGIGAEALAAKEHARDAGETAFLDSVVIAVNAVCDYASRLAAHCEAEAASLADADRRAELRLMAANLRQAPAGPAQTFWQALQAVWLLHMVFHSTMNGNAVGRLDQYAWPLLEADLAADRLDMARAAELVDCFCLKFNERAKTTDDQLTDNRQVEETDSVPRTRHYTSSQIGSRRDRIDATNHWLQNVVVGGLRPDGKDGTNPLTFLLLRSYRINRMTNPLLTVRLHRGSPDELVKRTCETLKVGGGMPAIFNDEAIVPALEKIGIPAPDARDYTNDGCWEVIIPGRTDFRFQRLSVMLCLEWALNRGRSRFDGTRQGVDTGDPRAFATYEDVWQAFLTQLDAMVGRVVRRVIETLDDRNTIAPVPLLSALIDGTIRSRRDMTAGGARYRTFGMLAEGAAHAIDSLAAIKAVIFEQERASMPELCDALDADFVGHELLRARMRAAPKYGNDDERADAVGRDLIDAFTRTVAGHAEEFRSLIKFPAGVGTFSWYVGIGEGLGPSPDGRRAGEPVSSNFSPALGRDLAGIPGAILSYAGMHDSNPPRPRPGGDVPNVRPAERVRRHRRLHDDPDGRRH